jgi:hypothetical protein
MPCKFGCDTGGVARRKTSFEVDLDKVELVKGILGTRTLTDTVDAALDEVIKLQQRRRLVEMLFTPGQLQLDDPEIMAAAWPSASSGQLSGG